MNEAGVRPTAGGAVVEVHGAGREGHGVGGVVGAGGAVRGVGGVVGAVRGVGGVVQGVTKHRRWRGPWEVSGLQLCRLVSAEQGEDDHLRKAYVWNV